MAAAFPPQAPAGQGALTFERDQASAQRPQQQPATARGALWEHKTSHGIVPPSPRGSRSPETSTPLLNRPSHEPLPNKSHHDAKRSRRASAREGNSPHAARRGWHRISTAPTAALLSGVPAEPPPKHTWMLFFPAHDLPDLLNKPPGSGKPAAFLAGKVVKGSNGCWKRQRGRTSL